MFVFFYAHNGSLFAVWLGICSTYYIISLNFLEIRIRELRNYIQGEYFVPVLQTEVIVGMALMTH